MPVRSLVLVAVAAAAVVTGACGSSGAIPRPFPGGAGGRVSVGSPPETRPPTPVSVGSTPETRPPTPDTSKPVVDTYALTGTALGLRGVPYRDGGSDPKGFDCSGFTQYVFGQHGVVLPREVKEQYTAGRSIKPDEISAGDLLFFSTVAPGASHVGIALGGDGFVHAPSSTGQVRVERITSTYWSQRFVGARRVS